MYSGIFPKVKIEAQTDFLSMIRSWSFQAPTNACTRAGTISLFGPPRRQGLPLQQRELQAAHPSRERIADPEQFLGQLHQSKTVGVRRRNAIEFPPLYSEGFGRGFEQLLPGRSAEPTKPVPESSGFRWQDRPTSRARLFSHPAAQIPQGSSGFGPLFGIPTAQVSHEVPDL